MNFAEGYCRANAATAVNRSAPHSNRSRAAVARQLRIDGAAENDKSRRRTPRRASTPETCSPAADHKITDRRHAEDRDQHERDKRQHAPKPQPTA